jgi:hypothetical protein
MKTNVTTTADDLVCVAPQRAQNINSREVAPELSVLTKRFRDALKNSVAGIIEAGRVLIEAKSQIDHGRFTDWVVRELRFGNPNPGSREGDIRKAQHLMFLSRH